MKPTTKMKSKIPTITVQSDECAINIGQVVEGGEITNPGTPYYVHIGEWVELLPVMTVSEVMQISRLQNATGDTGELGKNLSDLCKELSRHGTGRDSWARNWSNPITARRYWRGCPPRN